MANEKITLEEIISGLSLLEKMYSVGFIGMPDQMERIKKFSGFYGSQNYPHDFFDDLSKIAPVELVDAFRPVAKCIGSILVSMDILGQYGNTQSFFRTDGSIIFDGKLKPFYDPTIKD